jgi:hypothetical protein
MIGHAQSIEPKMQNTTSTSQEVKQAKASPTGVIKLNPSNKYNVRPKDVYKWLSAKKSNNSSSTLNSPSKVEKIAAAQNVADSVILYGLNYKDETWRTVSKLPMSIYSFNAAPVVNYKQESKGTLDCQMAAFYAKGKFYTLSSNLSYDKDYNSFTTSVMRTYDSNTWKQVSIDTLANNETDMNFYFRQVAVYDPTTDLAYSVTWGDGQPLVSINLNTKEKKVIGGVGQMIQSMFVDKSGQLYGIAFNDKKVYKIDKTTGAATELCTLDYASEISADPMSAYCEPGSGKVYWTPVDPNSEASSLCTINLTNGHVEKIVDFPGGEHFMGLYTPYLQADVPAAAKNINYSNGKLNFTAPTMTYTSGKTLSGSLTAYISYEADNNTSNKEVTVTPGQDVSVDLPLADGRYIIGIEIGNNVGKSPLRRLNTYVGADVPGAVNALTLEANDGKTANLTWTAPTTTMNGGPVDDATINYQVVRYPDETVVATGLKATSFSETIPEAHAHYYYGVTAYSNARVGGTAYSNQVTAGITWFPPYVETFDSQTDFDSFKVIDANNDSKTWEFMNPNNQGGIAYLNGNGVYDPDLGEYGGNGNNDYLITPQISLKKGIDYRVALDTYEQWMLVEHMQILLGTKQEVTGSETVLKSWDMEGNKKYNVIFNVPSDGMYYLMLHSDAPANSVNAEVDNLSIDVYSNFAGPDSVTNLTATAGAKGALNNTIKFNAPTKTYKGEALSSLTYINVYKNGGKKPVKVFNAPATGSSLTWTDNDVQQGSVTYRVVPFNAEGQGKEALVTNWVGLDVPSGVANVKAVMNSDYKAVVTYDKTTGVGKHGGYVNPDEVKYVLCRYNSNNWSDPWEAATDSTTSLTLTDANFEGPAYGAQQQFINYKVVAANAAGPSDGDGVGIVLGQPYDRPYAESFPGGYVSKDPWTLYASSYNYAWTNVTGSGLAVKPYDGDQGMLKFTYISDESNTQVISGPRVSLTESTSPELSFYMYHGFEAEPEDLVLHLYVNYDDAGWVKTNDISYNNGSDGWSRFSLPLRNDANNIQIAFGATAADASASIYIDNIKVDESVENDIAIESSSLSKKRIEAGESAQMKVGVSNYGTNVTEGYKVVILRGDDIVASQQGENIGLNGTQMFTFDLNTTKADASKSYTYRAYIDYPLDTNAKNDSSSVMKLYVHGSNLPAAINLTGATSNGAVTLNWNKPAKSEMPDEVTDDFESYTSFIIDSIGDWKTYDGDGTATAYFSGPQIAHAYEAKAWQVWAPVEAGFDINKFDVLTPHSGDKYLACWAASDGSTTVVPNDDWLISSDVMGGTDVNFYYRMPNSGSDPQIFEMLYSTTDQSPESFIKFDRDSIVSTTDWVKFEYTLPSDAKYFAVRSCCTGNYLVSFLDDITYTPLYSSMSAVTLTGYNVYRDNVLIASNVADPTYVDNTAGDAQHVYNVTAVWKEGESNYSNDYTSEMGTPISTANANNGVKVSALNHAILISNVAGMNVNVFTSAGQNIYNGVANDNIRVNVPSGVYLVRVANKAFKVAVK